MSEDVVSAMLQDLWLEFAKDPRDGLRNAGWSTFEEGEAVLIGDTDMLLKQINVSKIDSVCSVV